MNDDERAAREWLDGAENDMRLGADFRRAKYTVSDNWNHRATILRLLDRPVMPRLREIPLEVWDAMSNAAADNPPDSSITDMAAAYAVLYAHLTAPPPVKPKKVEGWAVVCPDGTTWVYTTREDAEKYAGFWDGRRMVKLVEAADD